jgi:nitrogen fixation NifU-like protein
VNAGAEDPLGPQVRSLFEALNHAGETAAGAAPVATARLVCGDAGREQRGTRVRFMLRLVGERLLEVRYRAYGCPHTLAACEWLSRQLESGGRDAIGDPADWARQLQIPPAKLGRLLVVEDALRAAFAAADKTMTDS